MPEPLPALRTLTDLREQYAAAIREVCGEGPWEVIVQRSTDAIMAIHDDDMDGLEIELERRGRVITGLQAQLQRAQAALPGAPDDA